MTLRPRGFINIYGQEVWYVQRGMNGFWAQLKDSPMFSSKLNTEIWIANYILEQTSNEFDLPSIDLKEALV